MLAQKVKILMDLVGLYKNQTSTPVNKMTGLADSITKLRRDELVEAYLRLKQAAPRRHPATKEYFVPGHFGVTSTTHDSNRSEEHLAGALWAESRSGSSFKLPDGTDLNFLDYQVPLKARRADAGIGAVDLFGMAGEARLCIIELKVLSSRKQVIAHCRRF